jgi:hypothetical protein
MKITAGILKNTGGSRTKAQQNFIKKFVQKN